MHGLRARSVRVAGGARPSRGRGRGERPRLLRGGGLLWSGWPVRRDRDRDEPGRSSLAQTAEPGQTLCDEETAKAARGRARFGATETRRLKGFDAPVPMCTPWSGTSPRRPPTDGSSGETTQRTLLSAGLDDLAAGRATAAVLLEGEPGIGKSRLAADLLASAEARHLAHHVGVARSVDRTTPYQPWREVMAGVLRSLGALDECRPAGKNWPHPIGWNFGCSWKSPR